ncbi:MAG TPA: Uma2 family endonuclease [Armatimonadota bacterium]|nr:Uma2 family endonuclease [Armatimonadota bacterium]
MAEPAIIDESQFNEHDFYPVHEEDSVPEKPRHLRQWHYILGAAQSERLDLWVTGDMCLYWERGNTRKYLAPDIAVIACRPPVEPENVYLAWSDPSLIFVGEIGSRSTLKRDTGPKVSLYEQKLRVPEYLYADPPKKDFRFWRMVNGKYVQIEPDERGRIWSEQLGLWFGFDETGFLRIYTADGRMLLTHVEERQRADEESRRRRDLERRLAEVTAELDKLKG